uniref:t-SNARE coiled-coil homology domain-containing protein n=1 Tax=Arion vulgaris TaxID=1028688 RepID=A0A0B7AR90_9EUPU
MSKYHQSSNPFDSDEDEGDFARKYASRSSQSPTPSAPSPQSSSYISSSSNANRSTAATGHQYSQKSNSSSSSSHSRSPYYEENSLFDDRLEQLQMKIANSENTQLESTQRALSSIYESEAMGVATAEELLRQAETLDNIENKLDGMQQNMKVSQRHLNNIKSVFGGIKNWWSGDKKVAENTPAPESANSRLRATIEKTEKSKPDVGGFYDNDDNTLDSQFMAGSKKQGGGQYTMIAPVTRSAREEEIDSNLGLMSDGMSRLKGLAMGLGDEIERQNEQLDRELIKVDRTDQLISHQNTQMKKILKR